MTDLLGLVVFVSLWKCKSWAVQNQTVWECLITSRIFIF